MNKQDDPIMPQPSLKFASNQLKQEKTLKVTIEGRKINNIISCSANHPRDLPRHLQFFYQHKQQQSDAFCQLFTKRSNKKASAFETLSFKKDNNFVANKKYQDHSQDSHNPKSKSHEKSTSKEKIKDKDKNKINKFDKSKSKLNKKSKSMMRLYNDDDRIRPEKKQSYDNKIQRKSLSPTQHYRSSHSARQRKHIKNNWNSKLNQEKEEKHNQFKADNHKASKKKKKQTIDSHNVSKNISNKVNNKRTKSHQKKKKKQNENLPKKQSQTQFPERMKNKLKKKFVITSNNNSKVSKNYLINQNIEVEQKSLTECDILDGRYNNTQKNKSMKVEDTKKEVIKNNFEQNYVKMPKKKERLSLNNNINVHTPNEFNKKDRIKVKQFNKSSKTEIETVDRISKASFSKKKKKQNKIQEHLDPQDNNYDMSDYNRAAIKIQKVWRGFLTRKYISQFVQNAAAIRIQKIWRGYSVRKHFQKKNYAKKLIKNQKTIQLNKNLYLREPLEQYLIEKQHSSFMKSKNDAKQIERWTEMLEQILEEQSVNERIKKKIEYFLQGQSQKSGNNFRNKQRQQNSNSIRSSLSDKKLQNEINSERKYFLKQQEKVLNLGSNKSDKSLSVLCSPKNRKQAYPKVSPYSLQEKKFLENNSDLDKSMFVMAEPEVLLESLESIHNFYRNKLISQSHHQKQILQFHLAQHSVSPTSHEKKSKEIDQELQKQINNFELSMNQVMKSCKIYNKFVLEGHQESNLSKKSSSEQKFQFTPQRIKDLSNKSLSNFNDESLLNDSQQRNNSFKLIKYEDQFNQDEVIMSPKKLYHEISAELFQYDETGKELKSEKNQTLNELHLQSHLQSHLQNRLQSHLQSHLMSHKPNLQNNKQLQSVQLKQGQSQNKDDILNEWQCEPFDNSYNFIEEYLLSLIEFARVYQGGNYVYKILDILKTPRNISADVIMKNINTVSESELAHSRYQNLEENDQENIFQLPMYKLIDADEEIIEGSLVEEFNSLKFEREKENILREYYLKMLVDCMNQSLNGTRPESYIFTQCLMKEINTLKRQTRCELPSTSHMESVVQDANQSELIYQYQCATVLSQIFQWNRVECGKIVNAKINMEDSSETQIQQFMSLFQQNNQKCYLQIMIAEIKEGRAGWKWHSYEEIVEIIVLLSETIFTQIVFQESYQIQGRMQCSAEEGHVGCSAEEGHVGCQKEGHVGCQKEGHSYFYQN